MRAIVLANTGSPDAPTPSAVKAYLGRFLMDPRISPMPRAVWWLILHMFILSRRSVASTARYAAIWRESGSPLSIEMEALAKKLENSLAQDGKKQILVRHAMMYGSPSIPEVFSSLKRARVDDLFVLPLYPQGAYSTSAAVLDKIQPALERLSWKPRLKTICTYHDNPAYISAVAESVAASSFDRSHDCLLLAYHSVPMADIGNGDAYPQRVSATNEALCSRLGLSSDHCGTCELAFQSRFDRGRSWLGPFMKDKIEEAARRLSYGSKGGKLFVVAPNFSVDCLETLYDIDIHYRQVFFDALSGKDESRFVYIPCLNSTESHIAVLRDLARDWVG